MESVVEAINSGMMITLDLGSGEGGVIEDEEMHVVELQCDTDNIVMDSSVTLPDVVEEHTNTLADMDNFTELESHCDKIITLWHVNSDLEFEVFTEAWIKFNKYKID